MTHWEGLHLIADKRHIFEVVLFHKSSDIQRQSEVVMSPFGARFAMVTKVLFPGRQLPGHEAKWLIKIRTYQIIHISLEFGG